MQKVGIEPAAEGQVALQLFEYAFLFVELLSTTDLSNAIPPLKMQRAGIEPAAKGQVVLHCFELKKRLFEKTKITFF